MFTSIPETRKKKNIFCENVFISLGIFKLYGVEDAEIM